MDKDIENDMINYGDNEPEAAKPENKKASDGDGGESTDDKSAKSETSAEEAASADDINKKASDKEDINNEAAGGETKRIPPVYTEREDYEKYDSSAYYFGGDDDEEEEISLPEEHYDFNFEHDDSEDGDNRLVIPMIKPIIKRLIPLFVILLIMIWGMTSDNFLVRNYRENFVMNTKQLLANIGIDTDKSTKEIEVGEVYDEDEASDSKNSDSVEYKEVATGKPEAVVQYRSETVLDEMITFEGANEAQFVRYGEGVVCASTNYLCYIDKKGKIVWEKNISVTDPLLRAEGDYFLVAQKGGTKFALYNGQKAVYEKSTEYNILTGNVSANGDVVLATEKPGYKSALAVYNKRGDNAFAWSSGSASIISVDISAKSRRVAAAVLNTDSKIKSGVYLFNIKKEDAYAQQSFDNTIIYNVDFKDDNLSVFADNALIGMKISGKVSFRIDYGDDEAARSDIDENGDKLILFTGTNIPMLNIYNKHGKLKSTVSSQKVPDYAYIYDKNIFYNVDREIFIGKPSMKIPYKYTAAMDIKGIVPIDDKTFMVIYSNSVAVVKMKGVVW